MRTTQLIASAFAVIAFVVLSAAPAGAHPLGNFTTNTYAGLVLAPDRATVDYVVDLAEIPTLQARPTIDAEGAETTCARLARRLRVGIDGRRVALAVDRAAVTAPIGQAGLATLRIECRLSGPVAVTGAAPVTFNDGNYAGRLGWREVTAVGDRARVLRADVPHSSLSHRLTAYPPDRLASPLDQRSARLRVEPGGAAATPSDNDAPTVVTGVRGVDRATRAFTSLVADRRPTAGFAVLAFGLAVVLGALHALAPGHGKTVMAAYLVGQRGTRRQALGVGLTVALTHTVGVLVLGIALTASQVVAPERLYPLLGLAGGVLIACVGAGLLRRSLRHRHHHVHVHDHHHHHDEPMGRRGVVAMGLAGGMVPSPSALLVLLGATALGRAWFGVVLVLAYGLGMAATLVLAGLVLSRLTATLERLLAGRGPAALMARALPALSAAVVLVLGVTLAVRATTQL